MYMYMYLPMYPWGIYKCRNIITNKSKVVGKSVYQPGISRIARSPNPPGTLNGPGHGKGGTVGSKKWITPAAMASRSRYCVVNRNTTQAIKCPIVELIPPTNVVEDGWTKKYVRTNLVVSKGLRKHWSKCPGYIAIAHT